MELLDAYFQQRKNGGENINDESPIFANKRKTSKFLENVSDDYARYIIYNMINASGLKRNKVSKFRYDKAAMHMFRKRFNTILKLNNDVNSNIAEKLMAHKRGLDGTHLQPTMDECFAEFVKAIPALTIDPTKRQKLEIIEKQNEIEANIVRIKQLEKQDDEIEQLKRNQERLEKMWYEATHKPIPQN